MASASAQQASILFAAWLTQLLHQGKSTRHMAPAALTSVTLIQAVKTHDDGVNSARVGAAPRMPPARRRDRQWRLTSLS